MYNFNGDLEFIVSGANIAGYMESAEKIYVDSDTELTAFLVDEYNKWVNDDYANESWQEHIEMRLRQEYGAN